MKSRTLMILYGGYVAIGGKIRPQKSDASDAINANV